MGAEEEKKKNMRTTSQQRGVRISLHAYLTSVKTLTVIVNERLYSGPTKDS